VVLINAFEVSIEADERFIAEWERARDFVAGRGGFRNTTLHRSVREEAEFRFADVAQVESPQAWSEAVSDPAFPGREMPFRSHPSLYEVVHDEGTTDGSEGVVLINLFEVPPDADEPFVAGWHRAREFFARQQGYLGTRLHRSAGPADFRFVNIARWSSPLMLFRALRQPEFAATAGGMPYASHPALYGVIRG
jgi:heme-degrading monooxygenase HmoA